MRYYFLLLGWVLLGVGCQFSRCRTASEQDSSPDVVLEISAARMQANVLVVDYRLVNSSSEMLYYVCPRRECGAPWNDVDLPFVEVRGNELEISSHVAPDPTDAVIEERRKYYLEALGPGESHQGVLRFSPPLRASKPYPIGFEELPFLDLESISRVRLLLGYIHCEDAFQGQRRSGRITLGHMLNCHGQERSVLELQQFQRAERALD